jgi:hypothetical protein
MPLIPVPAIHPLLVAAVVEHERRRRRHEMEIVVNHAIVLRPI